MRASEPYHLSKFHQEPYLVVKAVQRERFEIVSQWELLSQAEKKAASLAANSTSDTVYFVMEARTAYKAGQCPNPVVEVDFCSGLEITILGVE